MSALIAWASSNRMLALMFLSLFVFLGVYSFQHLPIDAVPDVTNVQVQVVTRSPSLSASEVEAQISQPVERSMAGIGGLKETRSISKLGISVVTLIFQDEMDVYFARTQVGERLQTLREQISPDIGVPELAPVTTALGEIYMFELKTKDNEKRSLEELRTIVEWQIAPKLRQVKGVVEIVGFGGALKQYQITLDPKKLSAYKVSSGDVEDAIRKDNIVKGGGYFERNGEQIVLRGDGQFRGIEDMKELVVRTDEKGTPVRIGELGSVDTGQGLRQGAMTRDGRGEVVGASVLMLKGENSRDVVERVKLMLESIAPKLPTGVYVEPYYDRASFINEVLHTVTKNLSEGALVVVLCLLLTLGSLKAGLLVAGAIPFAMLIGFIGLRAFGYSGNVMSLGAIDFGIVVEGAVLMVEHAVTEGSKHREATVRREAMVHGMQHVAKSVVFSVLITVLVFLPLMTLEDVEGKMFRPVVLSLCFMLIGALLYALVFVPAVGPSFLGHGKLSSEEPFLIKKLRGVYEPALEKAFQKPKQTLGFCFALALLMLGSAKWMGAEFLPRIFEGSFAIDATRPPSTSLPMALSLSKEMETSLRKLPEVSTVVSRIGRPEGSVDPAGPESSDVFVILKPKTEWRAGLSSEGLAEEISSVLSQTVPATTPAISQPIEMRVNDLIAGVKSDVAIKVFGDDLDTMTLTAEKLQKIIQTIPGATDVKREIAVGLPSVRVIPERQKLARFGMQAGSVLDTLEMAKAGKIIGRVREGERVFDLSLRLGGGAIQSSNDLTRLPIETASGELIPLGMVASVKEENTVVQISREQMRRRLTIGVNVRGRDVIGFVGDAQKAVSRLEVPKSVEVVWGGQFQNFNRAKERLSLLVPISFLAIAVMLVVMFKSNRLMLVTILSLPFAFAGGTLSLVLRGMPFSIPAAVGFIALAGVSVMTGIVLTEKFLELDSALELKPRVMQAAKNALRAPISTALVASVGFIPAALSTGTGSEIQKPLATVVIGGLLTGMGFGLFALPLLLYFFVGKEKPSVSEGLDLKREAR